MAINGAKNPKFLRDQITLAISQKPVHGHFRASFFVIGIRFFTMSEKSGWSFSSIFCIDATVLFLPSRRNLWPAPFTGLCLRNAHADRWFGLEIELMRHLDEESAKYAAARDAGDFDIAAMIAGEAIELIHDIWSARDLIERVVNEASALLTR
jgi:nitronate monooxygenase